MKTAGMILLFLAMHCNIFSQAVQFKGIVKDEQTLKPIDDVNIKVYGTTKGTSSGRGGNFSLKFSRIPATLIFSCVGYEVSSYTVTGIPQKPVEFLLRPKTYLLREVDISSKQFTYLFKDKDYSVLDYEIMGDNVLLLIFRYQLKRSELVLLTRGGDTLAISKLPEVPPASLFRDFLGNVHYFSKDKNAFQCFFNGEEHRLEFAYKTTIDSLRAIIKPYIFEMSGRLYFQETVAGGFGMSAGFYEKGTGKKYIRKCLNERKISEYADDQAFYQKWNNMVGKSNLLDSEDIESEAAFDFSASRSEGGGFGLNEARAHKFEFFTLVYPIIKTSDSNIAFFNFGSDIIELMTKDGKTIKNVPVTFHKEPALKPDSTGIINLSKPGFRWGNRILTDSYNLDAYALFLRGGMVLLRKIDLTTGTLSRGTVLPLLFPEKIEIYRENAYFRIRSDGTNDKWKLVKCKL